MNQRPRSVTVISWIFIVFGSVALLTGLLPKSPGAEERIADSWVQHPILYALIFVGPVLAVVCGIFVLRGCNWARWLLVVWFGYNVIVNVLRSPLTLVLPGLLFAVAVYFLFRPQASAFFRGTRMEAPQDTKSDSEPVG